MAPIRGNLRTDVLFDDQEANEATDKSKLWCDILADVPQVVDIGNEIDCMQTISMKCVQMVETICGIDINPFLSNGKVGHYSKPGGEPLSLSIVTLGKR